MSSTASVTTLGAPVEVKSKKEKKAKSKMSKKQRNHLMLLMLTRLMEYAGIHNSNVRVETTGQKTIKKAWLIYTISNEDVRMEEFPRLAAYVGNTFKARLYLELGRVKRAKRS